MQNGHLSSQKRLKTKPSRHSPPHYRLVERNLLKHDSRVTRYQRMMQFIIESTSETIADNLAKANIQFKDCSLLAEQRECLAKYHRNRQLSKQFDPPVQRFIVAAPRIHMEPECSRIGLYYKRRQIQHLKALRSRKINSSSGADTCYESNRNSVYFKESEYVLTKSGRQQQKNYSWAEALRSPIFEYFSEVRCKPKTSKEPGTKTKRKTSSSSSKKLRPMKTVKVLSSDNPYFQQALSASPAQQIKKSKSCSKLLKKQRPCEKMYTQASADSERDLSTSSKKSCKSALKSMGFRKKTNQHG